MLNIVLSCEPCAQYRSQISSESRLVDNGSDVGICLQVQAVESETPVSFLTHLQSQVAIDGVSLTIATP